MANHSPKKKRRTTKVVTATGKAADVEQRAHAERQSRDALRERTEEGHLKAGRTPPSRTAEGRRSGAVKIAEDRRHIDDSIRDYLPLTVTEDEKLLRGQQVGPEFTRTDLSLIHISEPTRPY